VIRLITVVGEAAYKMSEVTRAQLSHIPWIPIVDMRHRLIHAYFDVNLDILWATVQDDLPPLIQALEVALANCEGA
jgi:uncharacterized protein with HEPN domain